MSRDTARELVRALAREDPQGTRVPGVRRISREPFEYATSFPMELVRLDLEDGRSQELVLKHLNRAVLADGVRVAKPEFVHDPRREPYVYEKLLEPRGLDGGVFRAAWSPQEDESWLLLARVDGRVLFESGKLAHWQGAARLAAEIHSTMADVISRTEPGPLLDLGPDLLANWLERAWRSARDDGAEAELEVLGRVTRACARVEEVLRELPRTLVHGEFYAPNVLVDERSVPARTVAVDWEMAGIGPGLIDLAALTTGRLPTGWRAALEDAYRDELAGHGWSAWTGDFSHALECCRLYLVVQRLGWAPRSWEPPHAHHQDWIALAGALVEKIE